MSKVEDLALKTYPVVMTTLIPADDEHPLIEQDCNRFKREAYIKGYHQAEKDLELTWEDIKLLDKIFMNEKIMSDLILGKKEYEEILKRFKDYKERKEK